jgi:hypothetical protein
MGPGYFEPLIPGTQRQGGLSFCRPCLASSGSLAYLGVRQAVAHWRIDHACIFGLGFLVLCPLRDRKT